MGAKNYCKDKRDQAMRDYYQLVPGIFQSIINDKIDNGIQPGNGKPYYIGGKKGGGKSF